MRKMLVSVAALLFMMASLVVAAEVTVVKYDKDKKEVTVKDDKDKEKGGKGGGFNKLDITTDGDKITEVKMRAFGKKKDKE
jgi:hypothetical protein